jgi:hypothetical protein
LDFRVIEEKFSVQDIGKHLFMVSVIERRGAIDHFKDEDSKGPPVGWEALTLTQDDFGT